MHGVAGEAFAVRLPGVVNGGLKVRHSAAAEAFEVAQFTRVTGAAAAVNRMAARFAAGDDSLANIVGTRQDALDRWRGLDAALVAAVARAGMDPDQITPHVLRHTAVTHLVQAGVDLPTVRRNSGHKTLAMVARYARQNGAHVEAAMSKLQERFGDENRSHWTGIRAT